MANQYRSRTTFVEALLRWGAWLAGAWLMGAAVTLVFGWLVISWSLSLFLLVTLAMGIATWSVFAWDKRQAVMQSRRVPEATLHLLTLLGGWSGALLAQRWLRHKSQKMMFQVSAWAGMLLHLLALLAVLGWLQ